VPTSSTPSRRRRFSRSRLTVGIVHVFDESADEAWRSDICTLRRCSPSCVQRPRDAARARSRSWSGCRCRCSSGLPSGAEDAVAARRRLPPNTCRLIWRCGSWA
jgi:hypothetical protein